MEVFHTLVDILTHKHNSSAAEIASYCDTKHHKQQSRMSHLACERCVMPADGCGIIESCPGPFRNDSETEKKENSSLYWGGQIMYNVVIYFLHLDFSHFAWPQVHSQITYDSLCALVCQSFPWFLVNLNGNNKS